MKKLLILSIPILLFSCKKDAEIREDPNVIDSMLVQAPVGNSIDSVAIKDSMISNSKAVEKVLDEGVNRQVEEDMIVRTADAGMLPFTIGDQFTTDSQKFTLKISNVSKAKLKISLETKTPMNVRINQIKKPDGTFEGPFGRTAEIETSQKGEYSIIIGKNQMAEGSRVGHFSLKVE